MAARVYGYVWRFRGHQRAERLLAGVKPGAVLRRRFRGFQLYLDVARSTTHRLLYLEGERYVPERYLLSELVQDGCHIVDVGANIGYYTLLFKSLAGPRSEVICIEPDRANLVELERNVTRNRLANVRVLSVAAGSVDTEVRLQPGLNASVTLDGSGSVMIRQRRLDSLVRQRVDVLKVDVEGYEGHVLSGAQRILEEDRPRIFVEVHPWMLAPPYSIEDVLQLMRLPKKDLRAFRAAPQATVGAKIRARYLKNRGVAEESIEALRSRAHSGTIRESSWVMAF